MTTVIQPHPVYKNYGSAKDGSVYNYKGRKITVGTRHKRISVFDENKKQISILHRLFVLGRGASECNVLMVNCLLD